LQSCRTVGKQPVSRPTCCIRRRPDWRQHQHDDTTLFHADVTDSHDESWTPKAELMHHNCHCC
jgi:hypothetical protein